MNEDAQADSDDDPAAESGTDEAVDDDPAVTDREAVASESEAVATDGSATTEGDAAAGSDEVRSDTSSVDGPSESDEAPSDGGGPSEPGESSSDGGGSSEHSEPSSPENEPSESDSSEPDGPMPGVPDPDAVAEEDEVPADVRKYARFQKMDGAQYDRVNEFLRDRTYVTAREWAIARLCSDFRTETGIEMTKIGENLPELVPFMTDTYTPQAVNQARSSFEGKVRKSGATFLYGAMCDFFTAEELDDVMYEATEVAKFLLEVEGVDLSVEDELEAEERISSVMREVREASKELREEDDGSDGGR